MQKAAGEALARWGRLDDELPIHPANTRPVQLFTALATQWRTVSLQFSTMAMTRSELVKTGLDYAAVEPVARMKGLGRIKPVEFLALQILESEALLALAEERASRS